MFPDEHTTERWFESIRRGRTGRACPHCGSVETSECKNRKLMSRRCRACRKHFSVRVDTYHKMSFKSLHRYVGEFAGRKSVQEPGASKRIGQLARGLNGKRLRYTDLIAYNGLLSGTQSVRPK